MQIFWTQKKLFEAAAAGDGKTVGAYLAKSKGWAIARDKKTRQTALHFAAENGHAGVVKQLLAAGARVWWPGSDGQPPLHKATISQHAEIVRLLLGAGVDINQTDGNGCSPLQYAILGGYTDILKIFLDTKKADLNANDRPALYYAVENRQKECVRMLLAAGADPNVPRLEKRHEYGDYDDYPYGSSSKITVVKRSPLDCACLCNETEIALDLLKAGAKALPDETPLLAAAMYGNIELATALIDHGQNVNAKDASGSTALHSAAQKNEVEMVRFLLAQGAVRDVADKNSRTPLYYAQRYAMTDIIELLQGPLPALAPMPVKPVILPALPPSVAAIETITAPAPAATARPLENDAWALSGGKSVVHTTLFPALNRRLTEIFNFESRERLVITENFAMKTEAMGPQENFDNIGDEALKKAFAEFRRLGGQADESAIFGNRLMKMKIKTR